VKDRDELERIARTAMGEKVSMGDREPGYAFHHGLRTARLTVELHLALAEQLDADADLAFAGALFHDAGKGYKRHHEVGAAIAEELLSEHLSGQDARRVGRVVREHNQRDRAAECLPESRLVQDADILDHVGAVQVWQSFYYSGARRETPQQAAAYYYGAENQRWLGSLDDLLNFEISRAILAERRALADAFYRRFVDEIGPI
jgi:uncharacterized protein